MALAAVVDRIRALEAETAAHDRTEVPASPGPGATEAAITAAEQRRGVTFPADYRAFLALHDGWPDFAWGLSLAGTAALAGDAYQRGYLQDLIDEGDDAVTAEMQTAITIGMSDHDASQVMLCADGSVMDWLYEEEHRYPSFADYLESRATTLRATLDDALEVERRIAEAWKPAVRAKRDAAVARAVRRVLATATPVSRARAPKVGGKRPAAVAPTALVVKRDGAIVAEVTQHLVLFLGAYPSGPEVLAAYRAWRAAYPIAGELEWRTAGGQGIERAGDPDSEAQAQGLREALRVEHGHYGLRAYLERERAGRQERYVLNVRGIPPTDDGEDVPRASFVEVVVPASEDPAALERLATALLAALPVRSGYGGYAAYLWGSESDEVHAEVRRWCRRFFALDVGELEGWLPAALTQLRGAAWLTLLGPAFVDVLPARLGAGIRVTRSARGALVTAGPAPTLGDVARGEFPTAIAAVEARLSPLLARRYDRRGQVAFGGNQFATSETELRLFASHRATGAYVDRLRHPAAFLAPTAREQAEALLAALTTSRTQRYADAWAAAVRSGTPDLVALLGHLYAAATAQIDDDVALAAFELILRCPDAAFFERSLTTKAALRPGLAAVPRVLPFATSNPTILHNLACLYTRAGKYTQAVEAVKLAGRHGYAGMAALLADDDLAPLRERGLLRRLGVARALQT